MIKDNIIFICAFLIITQLVLISSDDIDWTTPHDELKKLAAPIRKKCLNEIGIMAEMVDGVESGNFPDDNKLACYFKCVMEKGGVMKKDGKINTKILMKMIPAAYKQIGNDMVNECRDTTGNDKCDLAYNFNKCMYRANPVSKPGIFLPRLFYYCSRVPGYSCHNMRQLFRQ